MALPAALLLLFLFSTIYYFSRIPWNYRLATKTGLPCYFSPVDPTSLPWLVIVTLSGYNTIGRLLPAFIFDRVKLTIPGWEFDCKYSMHARLGSIFILVTPGENHVYVADSEIGSAILTRRKDFGKPEVNTKILGMFGPSLVSVDHDEWKRHRRIIAPTLNERIMAAVWDESAEQAKDMIQLYTSSPSKTTHQTFSGLKTITINVIGSICFGTTRSFIEGAAEKIPAGFKTTLLQSSSRVVDNVFLAGAAPAKLLSGMFMPKSINEIGAAKVEFPLHIKEKIKEERQSPSSRSTLIASLVKLAEQDTTSAGKRLETSTYLTEEEIIGNLIAFTVAGYDTTANTLVYAILALVIYPKWQEWVIAGIDEVGKVNPKADYWETFPLLTRCLALMFETLRLYPPVPNISRICLTPQTIRGIEFPAGFHFKVSGSSVQTSPQYWGTDALDFRPARWLADEPLVGGQLFEPARGTFLPWSGGPRVCPGIKMSQVEFTAVIRAIFSKWTVEVVPLEGESPESARERVAAIVADSSQKLTLQVNHPEDIKLKWVLRS
ncbi:cytochrome P450 [Amylocarpus encephaloides]|uniref:Cytochrome P450 n=1 Tax=Amylocarpus encephaloides TaxID=45428 RepID=A0A9P8C944_9HELO|nr:cytochrome P450 [Amylocarpus encephaloides]